MDLRRLLPIKDHLPFRPNKSSVKLLLDCKTFPVEKVFLGAPAKRAQPAALVASTAIDGYDAVV